MTDHTYVNSEDTAKAAGRCMVLHCERAHHAKGLCLRHYNKQRPARDRCKHPPTIPAPPPEHDPLDTARQERAAKRDERADKRALEAALRRLDDSDRSLEAFGELGRVQLAPVAPLQLHEGRRNVTAVALLSDIHYGSIFPETASTFGNATNPAIIAHRIRRFFSALIWKVRQAQSWANIDCILVSALGDNVEGQLHEETVETAQPTMQSLLEIYPLYAAGLRQVREEFNDVPLHLLGSWGNHGRDTHRIRFITGARHSADWMLYQQIAKAGIDGLVVSADEAMDQYANVYGIPYHQQHGLSIGYQGGVGGLSIPLNKAVAQWNKRTPAYAADNNAFGRKAHDTTPIHVIGHWHQMLCNVGLRWFVNGSGKGYDPYVSGKNATPEAPQQWFFLIDSKRGPTDMAPLWLVDREAEARLK